jgi:hypothetical protein
MTDRFQLFSKMANGLLSYAIDAMFGDKATGKGSTMVILVGILAAVAILIVLLYAGAETVFLLTRKNFGGKGVKKVRGFISFAAFMYLAYFCYSMSVDYYGYWAAYGSEGSYWYASLTFLVLALLTLVRSFTAPAKFLFPEGHEDEMFNIYRGSSWLLSGLLKEKWDQSLVQDVAEPFLFVAIGLYLTSFNYVWGVPIMFLGFSCWFHLAVEAGAGFFKERKLLSNGGRVTANHISSSLAAR